MLLAVAAAAAVGVLADGLGVAVVVSGVDAAEPEACAAAIDEATAEVCAFAAAVGRFVPHAAAVTSASTDMRAGRAVWAVRPFTELSGVLVTRILRG